MVRRSLIASLAMAAGIIVAGFLIGQGLTHFRQADRSVTVKGLAEREVESNLAFWVIPFTATGNDLTQTQAELQENEQRIRDFLAENGFGKETVTTGALKVVDRFANQYGNNADVKQRYILNASLKVRTPEVKKLLSVSQKLGDLVKRGIVVGSSESYQCDVRLLFTDLNRIKPEMIAEATRDARAAAEQFARDSGANVSKIRSASQGYFSISSRDGDENQPEGSCEKETSLIKKIRVVITIQYQLN
jgi:uncharacterized protein